MDLVPDFIHLHHGFASMRRQSVIFRRPARRFLDRRLDQALFAKPTQDGVNRSFANDEPVQRPQLLDNVVAVLPIPLRALRTQSSNSPLRTCTCQFSSKLSAISPLYHYDSYLAITHSGAVGDQRHDRSHGMLAFRGSFDIEGRCNRWTILLLARGGRHPRTRYDPNAELRPGNSGVIFYTDILLPLIGGVLIWLEYRYTRTPDKA